MIHFVEDEVALLDVFRRAMLMEGLAAEYHDNWDTCNPKPGDLVVYDFSGVGKMKNVAGVNFITMSGKIDSGCDLYKPFTIKQLTDMIYKRL